VIAPISRISPTGWRVGGAAQNVKLKQLVPAVNVTPVVGENIDGCQVV
jgi:hypothetical protein